MLLLLQDVHLEDLLLLRRHVVELRLQLLLMLGKLRTLIHLLLRRRPGRQSHTAGQHTGQKVRRP